MFSAFDLPWCINEKYRPAANRDVMPGAWAVQGTYNFPTSVAMWTSSSVFVWLDFQPELFVPVVKSEVDDTISLDIE
jgi:hypothetical protein